MAMGLCFPDKKTIQDFLDQHPLTSDSLYKEKKINEFAAQLFANQKKVPKNINLAVSLLLFDLRKEVPQASLIFIQKNLNRALCECAKPFLPS